MPHIIAIKRKYDHMSQNYKKRTYILQNKHFLEIQNF